MVISLLAGNEVSHRESQVRVETLTLGCLWRVVMVCLLEVVLVCQAEERKAIVFQVEYSEVELWEKILVHCTWDGGGLELRDLSSL